MEKSIGEKVCPVSGHRGEERRSDSGSLDHGWGQVSGNDKCEQHVEGRGNDWFYAGVHNLASKQNLGRVSTTGRLPRMLPTVGDATHLTLKEHDQRMQPHCQDEHRSQRGPLNDPSPNGIMPVIPSKRPIGNEWQFLKWFSTTVKIFCQLFHSKTSKADWGIPHTCYKVYLGFFFLLKANI